MNDTDFDELGPIDYLVVEWREGAQLVASGRIPVQGILAALDTLDATS
ncbi:hypothetical protein W59_04916 [Rhodococcus opacus RKJ300 = JCM 13270]|uniref:Uncharacterized protein n=1 Tax=Rhodococcus opacus RKJ300 = JCM 13270 TaxID=1165867 RepID=I0WXS9_RHOOP|nr:MULTISPECIES: hypothetical protein [Rhodococcus]EID81195.1 hypothetical protein W59_04916 [Rhodococcus opacus RKJ300 = JCM 13270]QQZ14003.1 hypothetical protein GO592_30625 [Rhodococcus sp. 21391]